MRSPAQCWLTDMDGVLVCEEHALPRAAEFPQTLTDIAPDHVVLGETRTYSFEAIELT